MPFQYLEDEAIADIAFKAWGSDLNELFSEAAKAVYTLLTNVDELTDEITYPIEITANTTDKLLYKVLDEIIYLKDAELFFPKSIEIDVSNVEEGFKARGMFMGCKFNHEIHLMGNDIKAITYHDFYLKKLNDEWECYVLVDI